MAEHPGTAQDVVQAELRSTRGNDVECDGQLAGCDKTLQQFGQAALAEGSKADCDGQVADHILVKKHLDLLCTG
jgi:hypothetical protein